MISLGCTVTEITSFLYSNPVRGPSFGHCDIWHQVTSLSEKKLGSHSPKPAPSLRESVQLSTHVEMVPALPLRRHAVRSFTKRLEPTSFALPAIDLLYSPRILRSAIHNSPCRYLTPRSFYGHISDPKMAPQLEPFFKQYVNRLLLIACTPGFGLNCALLQGGRFV
jgi:hypothetical protein